MQHLLSFQPEMSDGAFDDFDFPIHFKPQILVMEKLITGSSGG